MVNNNCNKRLDSPVQLESIIKYRSDRYSFSSFLFSKKAVGWRRRVVSSDKYGIRFSPCFQRVLVT